MSASARPALSEPVSSVPGPTRRGAAAGEGVRPSRIRVGRAELLASRQATLLSLLAELLGEPTLTRALDAFAGALQRRFGAERVAIALAASDGTLRFATASQQANANVATAEIRLLLGAMEEACALERTVRFPERGGTLGVLDAHRTLAGRRAETTLASVPLYHDAELVGAVLLERRGVGDFADSTLVLLERIALAAAPVLQFRQDAERGALERLRRSAGEALERRLGGERPGARLLLVVGAVILTLAASVPIEHRVPADAELVPRERRLVTAPVDGFVDEVRVGAGERVEQGQLLARLDRRELELELARRDSETASAEAEFRAAMASHDRQATAVARARLERERALRALTEQRLARGELRAPIAGLIISGNPSDAVGMPVSRGDTLFEIAPSDGYEVHLLVDEHDVHEVHEGQRGVFALGSRPGEPYPLVVQSVHPVAESGEGKSRFRVRAAPSVPSGEILRPGQSGSARLEAGRSTLLVELLAPITRWLDESLWRLLG